LKRCVLIHSNNRARCCSTPTERTKTRVKQQQSSPLEGRASDLVELVDLVGHDAFHKLIIFLLAKMGRAVQLVG
jgi:hypothetical protein